MNNQFIKTYFPFFVLYLLVIIIAYQFLPRTFFQQDEWAIFGNFLYWEKAHLSWFERLFVFQQYTHLIPLSNLVGYLQFSLFHLHFFPYAIISILIHFFNSCLVYFLGYMLFKKKILAFLGGIFFLVNSIPQQAVTWIATSTGTEGSTLFILLSIIIFTKYLLQDKSGKKYLCLSLFFSLISLAFKETSIFIFLFFPFYGFILKASRRKMKEIIISIFVVGALYMLIRAIFVFAFSNLADVASELTQPTYLTYGYRIITMPLKVLAQSLIPASLIIQAGGYLIRLSYPQFIASDNAPNPFIVESVGVDIISFGFALILIVLTFLIYSIWRQKSVLHLPSVLIISLFFVALSSFPFIFVPGKAGFLSLLDGRHLYLIGIFASIFICIFFYGLYEIFHRKQIILFLLVIVFIFLSFLHIFKIRDDISKQIAVGQLRERLLNEILSKYPTLPKKIVFFIQSDKSFYGLSDDEKILPFQSGLGQTLLVWYNIHGENFPSCFFEDQFLYVLLSQGYRECGGKGFGYFREPGAFKKFIMENKVKKDSIIALIYDSSTNTITDNTNSIRKTISQ